MNKIFDAKGMACPLPVVNAKKESEQLKAGDTLTVLVDNEIAVQNLQRFASHKGFAVTADKKSENEYAVTMTITAQTAVETVEETEEEIVCHTDMIKKGMVVVLSADVMGTGDEKLGTNLMKAFVFALTKSLYLPALL